MNFSGASAAACVGRSWGASVAWMIEGEGGGGYLRQVAGLLGMQGEQKLAGKGRQPEDPVTAAGRVGLRVRLYHLQNISMATEISWIG
jgi:hypothetical protein